MTRGPRAIPSDADDDTQSLASQVFAVVARIPRGRVTTYGRIAAAVGRPRAARIIGGILHRAPAEANLPFHRVVNREGTLAPAHVFGGANNQRRMLEDEGIIFTEDGKIDMKRCMWDGESTPISAISTVMRSPRGSDKKTS